MKPYVKFVPAEQEAVAEAAASAAEANTAAQGASSKIGDLSQLTTTAKTNLVAAINEAAQSGGSGGAQVYTIVGSSTQDETKVLWLAEEGSTTPITTAPAAGSRIVHTQEGATMDAILLMVIAAPAAAGGYVAFVYYDASESAVETAVLGTGTPPEE